MKNLSGGAKNKHNPEHTHMQDFMLIHIMLLFLPEDSFFQVQWLDSRHEFLCCIYWMQY